MVVSKRSVVAVRSVCAVRLQCGSGDDEGVKVEGRKACVRVKCGLGVGNEVTLMLRSVTHLLVS